MTDNINVAKEALESFIKKGADSKSNDLSKAQTYALISIAESLAKIASVVDDSELHSHPVLTVWDMAPTE